MAGIGEQANALSTIVDLFVDKNQSTVGNSSGKVNTTKTGTSTTEEDVSIDKANALIRGILEGTNGIAAISSGKNIAGIYNDTSTSQLTNDLLSRTAGQVAALSSKKTTTSNEALDALNTQSSDSNVNKSAPLGWIICTELYTQGRLPRRYYITGYRVFSTYSETTKAGYHLWARSWVRHLQLYPKSKFSKFMEVIFNARAEYIAATFNIIGARRSVLGFITEILGKPMCTFIGLFVNRTKLYKQLES